MGNPAQLGETSLPWVWSLHGCGSFLVMGQDTLHLPCLYKDYLWGWGQWKAASEVLCRCFRPWQGEKVSRGDQGAAVGELWVQTALQPLNCRVFLTLSLSPLQLLFSLRLTPGFIQPHSWDLQKAFSKASAILLCNFKNGLLNKWNNEILLEAIQ